MIDVLKQWIINLCGIVILITATEMILPDNSIKKYGRYVLGLIIVLVLISPVIKLYNGEFDAETYLVKSQDYFQGQEYKRDMEIYKKDGENKTIATFKENLSKQCIDILNNTYKKDKFHIVIEVSQKENVISVCKINIGVSDGGVKKIKDITIGKSEDKQDKALDDKDKENRIKEILSDYTGVSMDKIIVYKEE